MGRPPVDVHPSTPQPSQLHDFPANYPPDSLNQAAKPVAVLVCHGMGQQVPFATLTELADRLSPADSVHQVRHVHFIDAANPGRNLWLPRAEIAVTRPGHPQAKGRPVHVYEVYWAPLAEGHVTITDVIRFLGTAGVGGLQLAFKPFLRWLFGKDRKFKIPLRTPFGLLSALLLILSLVAINSILTLVAGQHLLSTGSLGATSPTLVNHLTIDLGSLLLVGGAAGLALRLSAKHRRQTIGPALNTVAWMLLVGACLALVGIAALMIWHYYALPGIGTPGGAAEATDSHVGPRKVLVVAVWALALGASWWLRGFFVQYLGDVAIYVDAYKVDKYNKVREQIRQQAYQTACALYGAREGTADGAPSAGAPFLYDRIVMVGHSLGSVIAYDALNATLNLDETLAQRLAVKQRTGALITFGSPLDKTAFIFHAQLPKNSLRAALAASVQPLIRDVSARSAIQWINLYSPDDVISGKLEFYDYPFSDMSWRVQNMVDPEATTPAAAHNQYWDNSLLPEIICQAIFPAHTILASGPVSGPSGPLAKPPVSAPPVITPAPWSEATGKIEERMPAAASISAITNGKQGE